MPTKFNKWSDVENMMEEMKQNVVEIKDIRIEDMM